MKALRFCWHLLPHIRRSSILSTRPASMADNPPVQKLLWDDTKFAQHYSSAERLTGDFCEKLLQQAGLRRFPLSSPLNVLDLACGTGVVTLALQAMMAERPAGTFKVTCADLADAMVESICKRINDLQWTNTTALKADAQDTKLPSANYTHVFTNFGPMLFPNPSAYLQECNRMLVPQGICAFSTWQKVGWIDDFRAAFESMPDMPPFPTSEAMNTAFAPGNWSDPAYIRKQLHDHEFEDIRVEAVPNTSVVHDMTDLLSVLHPLTAIVRRLWTEDQRDKFPEKTTENQLEKWFEAKLRDGPLEWHWVALLATSRKSSK